MKCNLRMFGSWKTDFQFGYNCPSEEHVSNVIKPSASDIISESAGRYMLNVSFGSVFASTVADEILVRILLPEGASDIRLVTPFDVEETRTISYQFLDLTGHPTLELRKKNVVGVYHNRHIQVLFSVSLQLKWMKPIVVSGVIFLLLLAAMIYVRLDFTIDGKSVLPVPDKKEEKKLKGN